LMKRADIKVKEKFTVVVIHFTLWRLQAGAVLQLTFVTSRSKCGQGKSGAGPNKVQSARR